MDGSSILQSSEALGPIMEQRRGRGIVAFRVHPICQLGLSIGFRLRGSLRKPGVGVSEDHAVDSLGGGLGRVLRHLARELRSLVGREGAAPSLPNGTPWRPLVRAAPLQRPLSAPASRHCL